jgi:uncharacterized protein YjbI with pentapeptide repeats
MFTPIYLLPQFDAKESKKYQNRWFDHVNRNIKDKVISMIKNGAGEDFLQGDFENGNLGILEHMQDLKGIVISGEDITFPKNDNFEGIDFTYAQFFGSKFRGASFVGGTSFRFAKINNSEFINCIFLNTDFYGNELTKVNFINCDFIYQNKITNCEFKEVKFDKCFIPYRLFFDCKFDEQTVIGESLKTPSNTSWKSEKLNNKDLSEIYKGIKEGYLGGEVIKESKKYFFKEKQAITRYNANCLNQITGYFHEYITGYGINPLRVLIGMAITFIIFSLIFIGKTNCLNGLLLSAGAFFTFGANIDCLKEMGTFFQIVYILEAFLGIASMALFITVLANLWFRER